MPTAAPITRPYESLSSLLERKRMIDGAWVICLTVVLGAVTIPWFLHALDINLVHVAFWVFAYVVAHLGFSAATDRLGTSAAVAMALRAMLLCGVAFLTFFWHLVGGLQNPMFLAVFTLPVIMSGVLMTGAQTLVTALGSVLLVTMVAVSESPDLRWYVAQMTVPWIASIAAAGGSLLPPVRAVPGFESSPTYEFTLLVLFAAVQLTVAFLSRPLAVLLVRVNGRLEVSGKLLTEVQGLFHAVLRAEPDPAVIIYADSGQIVQASDSFFTRMLVRPSEMAGRGLFDVVQFEQAERVRAALSTQSGDLPFCVYRVHEETRIANVYFYRTEHHGVNYIYIGLQEVTELYYLHSAFDALEDPLMVVASDARLQYANRPARAIFGDLYFGMEIASVPKLQALFERLGDTDESQDDSSRIIDGQPYDVQQLVAQLPGEATACTVVWLHCVAKERALFEQAVRDPLTGAYNRRYFDDALARHVASSRAGRQLACAYCDLDYFKSINDQWGHAAGDAAIVAFARTVTGQLRAVDVFARLGGDEFAILFVNCDLDVAEAALTRIRTTLQTEGWSFDGQTRPLSFSSGLAVCRPGDDVEHLLQRTDKAVYAAKAAGKGRTATES